MNEWSFTPDRKLLSGEEVFSKMIRFLRSKVVRYRPSSKTDVVDSFALINSIKCKKQLWYDSVIDTNEKRSRYSQFSIPICGWFFSSSRDLEWEKNILSCWFNCISVDLALLGRFVNSWASAMRTYLNKKKWNRLDFLPVLKRLVFHESKQWRFGRTPKEFPIRLTNFPPRSISHFRSGIFAGNISGGEKIGVEKSPFRCEFLPLRFKK